MKEKRFQTNISLVELLLKERAREAIKEAKEEEKALKRRQPNLLKGKIIIKDDFEELPEELMKAFSGENE